MGKGGGKGGGHGGPKGGTPRGGSFGAGRIPGGQVQSNLNNHANMQNPNSSMYHPPSGGAQSGTGAGPLMGYGTGYSGEDDYDDYDD